MEWIISRLSEPSTWAGIGLVTNSIVQSGPGIVTAIASGNFLGAIEIVAGLVAIIVKEKGNAA